MDKATKVAIEKYPIEMYEDVGWRCIDKNEYKRKYFVEGYNQAQKDLALTKEDVRTIFNLVRELQVKYSATDGCLQEVADIFNEQRNK